MHGAGESACAFGSCPQKPPNGLDAVEDMGAAWCVSTPIDLSIYLSVSINMFFHFTYLFKDTYKILCKSVYVALPLHVCSNCGITGSGYKHSLGMSERVKWSWITSRHLKHHVDLYIGQECPGMPRKSKGFHHIIFLVPPWHKGWIICKSLCNSVPLPPQFSVPNCFPKGTEFEMLTELIGCTVVDGRIF